MVFVTDDAMVKTIIRKSEYLVQEVKGSNPGVSKPAKDFSLTISVKVFLFSSFLYLTLTPCEN